MNITVEQELKFPDTSFLSSVLSPEQVAEVFLDNKLMHSSLMPSSSMGFATVMQHLASLLHSVSTHLKAAQHCCLSAVSCWQGSGSSDFVDALTVAVDRLHRTVNDRPDLGKANVVKRIVLISNFLDAAKEDPDDTFGSILVERMQDKGVRMEVYCAHLTSLSCIYKRPLPSEFSPNIGFGTQPPCTNNQFESKPAATLKHVCTTSLQFGSDSLCTVQSK